MIFGASEDKDIQGMFAELMPSVKEMIFVKSFHPRAIEPAQIDGDGKPIMDRLYHIVEQIPEALEKALELADDQSVVLDYRQHICCC